MKIKIYKDLWEKYNAWVIIPTVIVICGKHTIVIKLCYLKSRLTIEISK